MDRVGAGLERWRVVGRKHGDVAVGKDAQHLRHRNAARRGRRHPADAPYLVFGADGFAPPCTVGAEIGRGETSGVFLRLNCLDDIRRDRARVKGVCAAGSDRAQRRRVFRIAQDRAGRFRQAVGAIEVRGGSRIVLQVFLGRQQLIQPRRHREAVLGKSNRRLEQARPGQLAVTLVRGFEQPHCAGCADGASAHDRVVKRHRRAGRR